MHNIAYEKWLKLSQLAAVCILRAVLKYFCYWVIKHKEQNKLTLIKLVWFKRAFKICQNIPHPPDSPKGSIYKQENDEKTTLLICIMDLTEV